MRRDTLLRRVAAHPTLQQLVPGLRAELEVASPIVMAGQLQRFASEEGEQQGKPIVPALSAIYLKPRLDAANASLQSCGGGVKGQMDDLYAVGPVREVFAAVEQLQRDLQSDEDGLELQARKCAYWSPEEATREVAAGLRLGGEQLPLGLLDRQAGPPAGTGLMVSGVPVGDSALVREMCIINYACVAIEGNIVIR